ncbi:MAG: ArsR/SmtB family transcription factor [Mycoplasmatales bacterium]
MDIYLVLKMLGEPSRLRIINLLYRTELSVNELQEALILNQANVSKHLKKLYESGLLIKRNEKQSVIYELNPEYVEKCLILEPILQTFEKTDQGQVDVQRISKKY